MSAILSADDLNDFISPGVACIKPVETTPTRPNGSPEVEIQRDRKGDRIEVSKMDTQASKIDPAQISLADCLACSGCITSADEILVAQHSHDELMKALKENRESDSKKIFIASISHQSRASIAQAYDLSIEHADRLLINLFVNQMGFSYVVGTGLGRKLSLINEALNIISRKESNFAGPSLSSICPGWVLYAEKKHPHILEQMSDVKSPQQITGYLLKTLLSHSLGLPRSQIYHLSIMPCFDKKLESARPEKYEDETSSNDVDIVLTAKEVMKLLEEHSDSLSLLPANTEDILSDDISTSEIYSKVSPPNWPFNDLSWSNDSGSASGGYAFHYLKYMKEHLILKDSVHYKSENFAIQKLDGRNKDIYELRLTYNGQEVANAAIVNGFKNIQNLVRKLKPSSSSSAAKINPLVARRRLRKGLNTSEESATTNVVDVTKCDYVEIMACPNGCINGGGQISAPQGIEESDWLSRALYKYNMIPILDVSNFGDEDLFSHLKSWCDAFCKEYNSNENRLFRTWFQAVEPPTGNIAITAGSKW